MSIPAIGGAAAGLLAPILANEAGVGKAGTRAKTFAESGLYNENAFHYGGDPNGANEAANRYRTMAEGAQGRTAPKTMTAHANYGNANGYDNLGLASRGGQNTAANLMLGRAQGLVPSIAGQQAALDMQRATAAQSSAAASARGAAGLALASQNAANNTATMQSAISNNAQINAANERLAAETAAYGAYTGMRAGDSATAAEMARRAQFDAQNINEGNRFNTTMTMNARAMNDAFTMGMTNNEIAVRNAELNAGMQGQGLLANSHNNATNQNVDITKFNANREMDYFKMATGAAQGGMTGALPTGGTPATPQPITGVSAPTAGTGVTQGSGGSTNMVGIPQPGTGSDDRMKMGMSPLGLLGVLGGGGSAGSSGAAPASFDVIGGNGGMNVMASHKAHSDFGTRFQSDPTGGMMGGGLLSDERAKREAFELGAAYAVKNMTGETMEPWGDSTPWPIEEEQPEYPTFDRPIDSPNALPENVKPDFGGPVSSRTELPAPPGPNSLGMSKRRGVATEPLDLGGLLGRAAIKPGTRPSPSPGSDPMTTQLAQGLAPISFEYKPGMGPPGRQTGVRAQAAATQPLTSSMVTRRPDGLLQIDPQMGLSTALAGVGNSAQKQIMLEQRQREQERKLNGLLALAAKREGY